MSYVKIAIDGNPKRHASQVAAALNDLKKQLKKDNFQYELKRREFYMSPSTKKRFKRAESLKRIKRENRKQQWFDKKHGDSSTF